LRKLQSLV